MYLLNPKQRGVILLAQLDHSSADSSQTIAIIGLLIAMTVIAVLKQAHKKPMGWKGPLVQAELIPPANSTEYSIKA